MNQPKKNKYNPEALNDSFKLFKNNGYGKNQEDFVKLINSNENALKDSYQLFANSGYKGSLDDYKSLVLKKKDTTFVSSDGSSVSQKSNSPITQVGNVLDANFEDKSTKPKQIKPNKARNIPTSNTQNLGQSLSGFISNPTSLFQEYQQAKSLTNEDITSVKQELDDEINNEGILNNITNLAKSWWNGVFSQEEALQIEKNPLAKHFETIKKKHGNNITPQEISKIAYDLELESRAKSLSESKERSYLTDAQNKGRLENLKKEQLKIYDERSKEYNNAFLKDGALKKGLEEQSETLLKLKSEIDKLNSNSPEYNQKVNEFASLQKQYETTFNEYKSNNDQLQTLGSEVSTFEHNLDMLKRDYGYWSNFTHRITNALGDTGKGLVTLAVEAPLDYAIGQMNLHGKEAPTPIQKIKDTLSKGRSNYDQSKIQRQEKHAKDLQVDDINSLEDFGKYALDLVASQSFNLVAASTGLGGIATIGMGATGQKRSEMLSEMERGESDYNALQQIGVPLLVGGSEMIGGYVDRLMLGRVASTIKSASSSERRLITESMAKKFSSDYLKSTGQEIAEETSVQVFQNILDKYALGKKDVNILDGVKDAAAGALVLTSTINAGGGLASVGLNALKPFSYDKKISKISEQILKLETQLSNSNIDESTRKIVTEQITKLKDQASEVVKNRIGDIESLSDEQFQEILSLEKQQSELRQKATDVKKSSLDNDAKADVLKGLEEEFKTNDQRRVALLQRGASIQLERLPEEDQIRLKDLASRELMNELNPDGTKDIELDDNQISKKALQIFRNEQKSKQTKETTTKEEEVVVNNNEEATETEYNAQDDLDFLESLDIEERTEIQTELEDSPIIGDIVDSSNQYTYNGENGHIRLDGQQIVFETSNTIHELGNVNDISDAKLLEFGIEPVQELNIEVADDFSVTIDGKTFVNTNENPSDAIVVGKNGEYSVTLENDKGQKRTIRGQRAEQIAYNYKLKELENATEQQIEQATENTRIEIDAESTAVSQENGNSKQRNKKRRKKQRSLKQYKTPLTKSQREEAELNSLIEEEEEKQIQQTREKEEAELNRLIEEEENSELERLIKEEEKENSKLILRASEKGEPYTVIKENGLVIFKDSKGNEPSPPTKRKLQKEYVKTQDFSKGRLATESDMEQERNMNSVIAKHSENPLQVAESIINISNYDYESYLDYKYVGIADFIGKVERSSFLRFGDANYINLSIGKNYIAKKGKGQQIDTLAQEISSVIGVEVTEQDIIDFIVEYPAGVASFKNQHKNQDLYDLKLKFEKLTGLPATETVLHSVLENSKDLIKYQNSISSIDLYSDEDLIQLFNERQEWESSIDRIGEITNENQNSGNNGEVSRVQRESSENGRGEKEKSKSEPVGIDLASDEELEQKFQEQSFYDKLIDTLGKWEKGIDKFGNENLSMGLPLVLAKGAIKVMKATALTTKKADEIIRAGLEYIKQSDWYKNLNDADQKKITFKNFKQLIAESIRQSVKSDKQIDNLLNEITDLRQKLADNKIEAAVVSSLIKDYLKANKITGKVTPTEINRLVMYANRISTAKDKLKAFDDFVNTFEKINKKAQDRSTKLSDRQRVEKRINKELDKGKSEQEIIDLFKENSTERKIAEDYFERTKVKSDDEIREKLNKVLDNYYENKYKKNPFSKKLSNTYEKMYQAFFDRMFTVRKLLDKAGMNYTNSLLIATKGAPGYANYVYNKAHKEIFSGLTNTQNDNLNLIIRLRRIIAIENDGLQKGKDPMVHAMNFNLQQAEQALKVLENDLGSNEFASLQERANNFFKHQQKLLTDLFENGIITEEFYNDIKDVEYIKTSYLDFLTDVDQKTFDFQKGASTNSGIESMKSGWNGTVELNANELLAQSIQTTIKAIATNKLNSSLASEFTKNKEKVDLLRSKSNLTKQEQKLIDDFSNIEDKIILSNNKSERPPINYTKVNYYEKGEVKSIFMENSFYNVFADNIGSLWGSGNIKEIVQTATGVKLIKTIATGQNPTFFITNTPRDFFWILNTSMQYSDNVLKGGLQLSKDFFKGSLDVKRDSLMYQKAVEYGLMMDFLHLQGKLNFNINPRTKLGKTIKFLGENRGTKAITYLWEQGMVLGKYSEIGFRMAVFNRTVNNLLEKFNKENNTDFKTVESIDSKLYPNAKEIIYTESVVEARMSTVDFNQGGHLAKDMEAMIPYFNAASQGARMLVEKVSENPVQTSLRFLQTAGIVTGMGVGLSMLILKGLKDDNEDIIDAYNKFYSGVSKFDRANYMVIPIGKKDNEYQYTRIALPQALTPFFTLSRGITHEVINRYYGKQNVKSFTLEDTQFALDKNVIPVEVGVSDNATKIPIIKAALSYTTGYDFFREQDISLKRGKVDERVEGFESKSVEGFYKTLGSEFEFSPARAKVATESLITTPSTNIGVGIAYGFLNTVLSNDKEDKEFSDLALKSFGGRLVKETSDFNRKISNTDLFKDKKYEKDLLNAKLEYQANIEVKRFYEGEIKKSEAISSIKEIFSQDQRRIKNYIGRLDKNYTKFSNDAQEIKFASADNKALLLKEHFGNNLFNQDKLNDKQKQLKKELIKLKVLTPSVKQAYSLEIKD